MDFSWMSNVRKVHSLFVSLNCVKPTQETGFADVQCIGIETATKNVHARCGRKHCGGKPCLRMHDYALREGGSFVYTIYEKPAWKHFSVE